VEDVPPGDYELTGQLSDSAVDLPMRVMGHTIGAFRQDITVPQPGDGQSIQKINIGTIPVQSLNHFCASAIQTVGEGFVIPRRRGGFEAVGT
jgi:hypothetical protein